ncbi:MAG: succinate dehydrogenase [Phycisphaerae bacterium]|nr:succinate dehydrogenase [Phycisphaerae bacterium]
MARQDIPLEQVSVGVTARKDNWWIKPLLVFLGFSTFIVYSTWAAFQNADYFFNGNGAQYLSPFYSPLLYGQADAHPVFGTEHPAWWPGWLPFSPALLILWAPGGFRFTCYYYRGAYYKSFWLDPPACAVGEPRKGYRGEQKLPLILQNIHRYFLYVALLFIVILTYDAVISFIFVNPDGTKSFGIGIGSFVITINVILLSGYTLGCHSFRHMVGGKLDCFSKNPVRAKSWECVTCLNSKHMTWAWFSLFWVGFTDLYVRLCAAGIWTDWRIL